jgi:hypothetical protein
MSSGTIMLKFEGDTLVPVNNKDVVLFNQLRKAVGDGTMIGYLDEADSEDHRNYLAKVHKSIRVLSFHTGFTFEEMKSVIKKRSGLYMTSKSGIEYKSFAYCTKEELMLAIQACVDLSIDVDVTIY